MFDILIAMKLPLSLWLVLCAMTAAAGADSALHATPPAKLVLTSKENGVEEETEFFCAGTIHGYIRLPKRVVGSHLLEGKWILPNGAIAAESRDNVNFPPPGRSTAYLWFAFPERSAFPGALDPEADAKRSDYPGRWRVEVRWDEQLILKSTFTVTCR